MDQDRPLIQTILKTPRLLLRPLEPRDDGQFWRLRTDPVVRQWLDGETWVSVDRAREQRLKLQAGINAGKWFFWALAESSSSPLIGTVCLWNFTADRTGCEIGFELFASWQGRGLMAEAVEAVLTWAWQSPLQTVSALTHRDNRPARAFLETRGFLLRNVPSTWELSEEEVRTQVYYEFSRPVTVLT
jgi:ribosomal-protein-alanine N-acetyltransferase